MDTRKMLEVFSSGDEGRIVGALFELGALVDEHPGVEVLERATAFFLHPDMEVRRQSIVAVAVHWGYVPALKNILTVLEMEQEDMVLTAAVSGVSRIGEKSPSVRGEALLALERVVLNDGRPGSVRHFAFVEAKRMCGDMNVSEYAKVCLRPEGVPIELDWFGHALKRMRC